MGGGGHGEKWQNLGEKKLNGFTIWYLRDLILWPFLTTLFQFSLFTTWITKSHYLWLGFFRYVAFNWCEILQLVVDASDAAETGCWKTTDLTRRDRHERTDSRLGSGWMLTRTPIVTSFRPVNLADIAASAVPAFAMVMPRRASSTPAYFSFKQVSWPGVWASACAHYKLTISIHNLKQRRRASWLPTIVCSNQIPGDTLWSRPGPGDSSDKFELTETRTLSDRDLTTFRDLTVTWTRRVAARPSRAISSCHCRPTTSLTRSVHGRTRTAAAQVSFEQWLPTWNWSLRLAPTPSLSQT